MLDITKGPEPAALRDHRLSTSEDDPTYAPSYDDTGWDKAAVKDALLADQADLCAYCADRITRDRMKIEHRAPQSGETKHLQLTWSNLLGACPGNEGQPKRLQHCDTAKRSQNITLDPVAHPVDDIMSYTAGGLMQASNASWQADIDDVLRLNIDLLRDRRKAALRGVLEALGKRHRGRFTAVTLRRQIARLSGKHRHAQPDRPFILFHLRKRLAR